MAGSLAAARREGWAAAAAAGTRSAVRTEAITVAVQAAVESAVAALPGGVEGRGVVIGPAAVVWRRFLVGPVLFVLIAGFVVGPDTVEV